jgi:hypothetical protein
MIGDENRSLVASESHYGPTALAEQGKRLAPWIWSQVNPFSDLFVPKFLGFRSSATAMIF